MMRSKPEATLALHLRAATDFYFEEQYDFHPKRAFQADFAVWPHVDAKRMEALPLLVEIDGAKKGKPGAHQRVDGVDYDCRRAAQAMLLGYRMLRVSSRMVRDGTALATIEALIAASD